MAVSKNHPETSPEGLQRKADAEKADAGNAQQVADKMAKELDQGFRGVEVDSTPNENYSVQGVTSGAPTPETDEDQAEQVRRDAKAVEAKAAGVSER